MKLEHETLFSLICLYFIHWNVVYSASLSGTILNDTTFYYKNLDTYPSKLATVEYSVWYNPNTAAGQCSSCYPRLDIYTTRDDKNLVTNCANDNYGQLRNEDLHEPLKLRREQKPCRKSVTYPDWIYCHGTVKIQDYMPRLYGFSFGYSCSLQTTYTLKGLMYNISIDGQRNKSDCVKISSHRDGINCSEFYPLASFPNFIGDPIDNGARAWFNNFEILEAMLMSVSKYNVLECYAHLKELVCYIMFPKCDSVAKQVVHPCEETCEEMRYACKDIVLSLLHNITSFKYVDGINWKYILNTDPSLWWNCSYLPSAGGSIPCFYKPVTCSSPPRILNTFGNGRLNSTTTSHSAMSTLEFTCENATFQMEGNKTITCLYSGKWSELPRCSNTNKGTNPLMIVVPILLFPMIIFLSIVLRFACRTLQTVHLHKRHREYDAFVCYNFDEDFDFVFDSILPELEDKHDPPLKMLIHDRDFIPGREITINICNAMENSNSAIIVMSQGFVDSPRCREEFTKCLAESEKDPGFKLFAILTQEANTLIDLPENMKVFFKEKTFLKKDDTKLFDKIGNHLVLNKQHDLKGFNAEGERLIM